MHRLELADDEYDSDDEDDSHDEDENSEVEDDFNEDLNDR